MSLTDLSHYIIEREKYINLFKILNRYDVIRDIKTHILSYAPIKVNVIKDFDKNIKSILTYIKDDQKLNYKLTVDAYHFLNFLIIGFIHKLELQSITIMEHCRRKRLIKEDVEYSMGLVSESKLLSKIMNSANDNVNQFNHSQENKIGRQSRSFAADTLIDPPKVQKWMLITHPIKPVVWTRKNKKYIEDKIQVEKQSIIYITGILDTLIEQMILQNNESILNIDDLLQSSNNNMTLKHLLLDLFDKDVMTNYFKNTYNVTK